MTLSDLSLVLASKSPRRAELLRAAGIDFTVRAVEIDESVHPGEAPEHYVLRLAREKANAVEAGPGEIVLAADTTVVIRNELLGKPEDDNDAQRMLLLLSGHQHQVITGICLRRGADHVGDVAITDVWFARMNDQEIDAYVASGEPKDKAGGYGIQGIASKFIDRIEGSYTNVVGLPVSLVYQHLSKLRAVP